MEIEMVRTMFAGVVALVCLVTATQGQEKIQVLQNGDECCFLEVVDGWYFKSGTTEKAEIRNDSVIHTVLPGRGECENFFDMGELGLHYVSLNLATNGISDGVTGKPFQILGSGKMYRVVYSSNLGAEKVLDWAFPRLHWRNGYIQGNGDSERDRILTILVPGYRSKRLQNGTGLLRQAFGKNDHSIIERSRIIDFN